MGRPKPHKSLPIPQITEKTLTFCSVSAREVNTASMIFSMSGMNAEYFTILCKAVGITYLTQLGMDFCRDCGENAICTAVELFGRVSLLTLALPLFSVLVRTVLEVIG